MHTWMSMQANMHSKQNKAKTQSMQAEQVMQGKDTADT